MGDDTTQAAVAAVGKYSIPADAQGLRLCRMKGDKLLLCECVMFSCGALAVDMVLRRASISGDIGRVGETGDQWADIMSDPNSMVETIGLSLKAWMILKTHWMRCRYDSFP